MREKNKLFSKLVNMAQNGTEKDIDLCESVWIHKKRYKEREKNSI